MSWIVVENGSACFHNNPNEAIFEDEKQAHNYMRRWLGYQFNQNMWQSNCKHLYNGHDWIAVIDLKSFI